MGVPRNYMYLDAEGIESLYSQTVDRIEVEFTQSLERGQHGDVSLKAGFGNMLTSLLGLKEASAETKLGTSSGQVEEAKSRLTTENKLSNLLKYLAKHGGSDYFESLQKAAESICENR